MEKKTHIVFLLVLAAMAALFVSCKKEVVSPIVGHWGCAQYVSCRTDSLGNEQWDTSYFEVATGGDYELFFNANGTGKLKLNHSPAFILPWKAVRGSMRSTVRCIWKKTAPCSTSKEWMKPLSWPRGPTALQSHNPFLNAFLSNELNPKHNTIS